MPKEVFWGNTDEPMIAVWMANWMVEENYRTGVGPILFRRMMEMYPVVLGQGASGMNKPIAEKMGFRVYPEIPRHVAIFDAGRAAAFKVSDDVVLPDVWTQGGGSTVNVHGLPADYDPDWSLYPDLRFGTVRKTAYLEHRFLNHPVFDYEIMVAGSGREPAVCVFRIEQSSGSVSDKVGRFADFYFPATEDGEKRAVEVMQAALAEMARQGCAFADIYCTPARYVNALHRAGMTSIGGDVLATRMNPVEHEARDQNIEIWVRRDMIAPPEITDLYLMKSDGDQDRPN